ncbi:MULTISPECIES: sulfotransferase [Thermomonosporaceae]|uniref:sulfotransferase n=1 Tax=Thermomonosporaceae TaxID=2012 RepID=UPI00255AC70D|nr:MULTISPECIES: sulfotransferase [Thermomonosporaceae]MDL4771037.1 sulfotransferase [Actinomadura xylanilytica]
MIRVLYVTGWCRSGTTLLGNLLGEVDGALHTGELRYLWTNGVLGRGTNTQCGCGRDVDACPLWTGVLDRLAGDEPAPHAERAVRRQQAALRTRHTGRRLAEARGAAAPHPAVGDLVRLYGAIAEESGARLIIDTGKFPAEAAALCGAPGIDARILHVVRDPRATAESWRRAKRYIPPMGPVRSTGYWVGFNLASERVGRAFPSRYQRLRYEDFAARPRDELRRVMERAGLDGDPPVGADGVADLGVNHTVTGNPDRLHRGPVRVRADDAWVRTQPRRDRALATVIAAPLLARYGYPLTPAPHGP